jgi:hypothetical protein
MRIRTLLLIVLVLIGVGAVVRWARRTMAGPPERDRGVPSPDPWLPISPEMRQPDTSGPTSTEAQEQRWVDSVEGGSSCPAGHPIKANMRSGIYHLPGMLAYDRTRPDRCYADEASAEADGLTRAKR